MPPKKKDGKAGADEEEPSEEAKDLLEKELVISYLKMKLAAYQDQTTSLQAQNHGLSEELEAQKGKLKDINDFLVNELKARALSFAVLQSDLNEARKAKDDQKETYEKELARVKAEDEAYIAELLEKMADSDRKARSAEEYLAKREELLAEMAGLREALAAQKSLAERQVSELERQHVQDRDQWKKTMHKRIQETKQFMMKLTDNQLEMTTKRTIMENEQMSAEMAYQSRQSTALLGQNQALDTRLVELKQALALSRETENELAKRNTIYQSTIKQLLERLQHGDEASSAAGAASVNTAACSAELSQQVQLAHLQLENQTHEIDTLRAQLGEAREAAAEARGGLDGVGKFLMQCMDDVKAKVVSVEEEQTEEGEDVRISVLPGRLDNLNSEQRERVLTYLMDKLNLLQGPHKDLLGAACPTTPTQRTLTLPSLASKPPVLVAPAFPPSSAAALPPRPGRAMDVKPLQVAPWHGMGGQSRASTPGLRVTVSTQTMDPHLAGTDELLSRVLSNVRPWGATSSARKHEIAQRSKSLYPPGRLRGHRGGSGARGPLQRGRPHVKIAHVSRSATPPSAPASGRASHFRSPLDSRGSGGV